MTVVFLHPISLDGDCWKLTGLSGEFFTYPGHGDRPLPAEGLSLEAIADEVAETFAGPLDLVGVSMGSHVAQYVAARHPRRVRSLVVTAGGRKTPPPEGDDPRAEQVLRLGTAGTLDWALDRWFTAKALETKGHPGVEYVRKRWLANDPRSVAAGWNALRRSSIRARAGEIGVPVTVVGCRYDQARGEDAKPLDEADRLAREIPKGRLRAIDGPHMVQLECPAEYAAVVTDHLDWVDRL